MGRPHEQLLWLGQRVAELQEERLQPPRSAVSPPEALQAHGCLAGPPAALAPCHGALGTELSLPRWWQQHFRNSISSNSSNSPVRCFSAFP